jgi:hypothetical protein
MIPIVGNLMEGNRWRIVVKFSDKATKWSMVANYSFSSNKY